MTGPDQNGRPRTAPAAARDPGDVRMRGFSRRAEVADVWQWIGQYGKPLPAETVAIDHATGRVLATRGGCRPRRAGVRSRRDGRLCAARRRNHRRERLQPARVPRDRPGAARPAVRRHGRAGAGGAHHDRRADARRRRCGGAGRVRARDAARDRDSRWPVAPGKHVGRVGEDIARGMSGARRGPAAAPAGRRRCSRRSASRRSRRPQPRVRIVVTGNEVVAPGVPKDLYQIYDANSYMLRGLVARDGGVLEAHLRSWATTRRPSAMRSPRRART